MVRTLYNHPSIVTWVPFNEGWGQSSSKKSYRFYSPAGSFPPGRFCQRVGLIRAVVILTVSIIIFLDFQYQNQTVYLLYLNFGGFSLRLPEHSACRNIYGYKKFTTSEALTDGFSRLMENTIVPSVKKGYSATVFTQLSDIEEETNGLITYDRKKIKMNPLIVQKWNTKLKKSLHS